MAESNKMKDMPVNKLMIQMGIPMILSMALQAVYNIVDSAFVGNMRVGSEAALNALTLVFPVQMNTAPAVEAFLRADTNKETGAHRIFPLMQPFGKVHLEFVIPHFLRIERERFFRIRTLRHLTHPKFLHALVPGTPITLIHGCAGGDLERDTYPVDFQNILIGFQYAVYIVYGYGVLYLIIHMKHTQFSL